MSHRITPIVVLLLASTPLVTTLAAQTALSACYVPGSGTVYRVGESNTPPRCAPGHTGFTWGASQQVDATSSTLAAAAVDDHPQYLLKSGVRKSNNGFAVRDNPNHTGTIPIEGAGKRFMWYAEKAALRSGQVSGTEWDDNVIGYASAAFGANTSASGHAALAVGSLTKAVGSHSMAAGREAKANGFVSVALGDNAVADGSHATALGFKAQAAADFSFAAGNEATATGFSSFALGYQTAASGFYATALGHTTRATAFHSFAAGRGTKATSLAAVALGYNSTASGNYATALGGSTTASGHYAFAVGRESTASGPGAVAMGYTAVASGNYSTAIGYSANTNGKNGSFVYGDLTQAGAPVNAAAANQFVVRAQRIWLGTNNSVTATAGRYLETSTGAYLTYGGTWTNASDVARKHAFDAVDAEEVLGKIAALPIRTWSYIAEDDAVRHIGPTAQDFHAAFGVGDSDKSIATVDADGVSLAAIQALERRTTELQKDNDALRQQLTSLVRRMAELEARIHGMEKP